MKLEKSSEIIISLGGFNGYVGKRAVGFEDVHGRMVLGKDCWSSVMKKGGA